MTVSIGLRKTVVCNENDIPDVRHLTDDNIICSDTFKQCGESKTVVAH